MLARKGFSFMSKRLGAGVSIGVCGIRKPECRLEFINSALSVGPVLKPCEGSWWARKLLPPPPPVDIAQLLLSSILIIVLFNEVGRRCELRDGTLFMMLMRGAGSPDWVWIPPPVVVLPMYCCFRSLLARATSLVLVWVC